jgi:hypothetical protein
MSQKHPPIHWVGEDGRNVFIEIQGRLLAVAFRTGPNSLPMPPRKEVKGFSRGARFRMLKTFQRLDWHRVGSSTFGTTTWRDEIGRPTGRMLTQFRSWLHRSVETMVGRHVSAIWRTEWVPRLSGRFVGEPMPHVHWIYLDIPRLDKEEYAYRTAQAMGVDRVRTQLKAIKGLEDCMYYVSKKLAYVAKASCVLVTDAYLNKIPNGRQWSVMRRPNLPLCDKTELRLAPGELVEKIREIAIEEWDRTPIEPDAGFTVFGPASHRVRMLLAEAGLTTTTPTLD